MGGSSWRTFLWCLLSLNFPSPTWSLSVTFTKTSSPHRKPLLLPAPLPQLIQDPQNVPLGELRYFGFDAGGELSVDLKVTAHHTNAVSSFTDFFPAVDDGVVTARWWGHALPTILTAARTLVKGPRLLNNVCLPQPKTYSVHHTLQRLPADIFGGHVERPLQLGDSRADATPSDPRPKNAYLLLFKQKQWEDWVNYMAEFSSAAYLKSAATFSSYIAVDLRVALSYDRNDASVGRIQAKKIIAEAGNYVILLLNAAEAPLSLEGSISLTNPAPLQHLSTSNARQWHTILCCIALNAAVLSILAFFAIAVWKHAGDLSVETPSGFELYILLCLIFGLKIVYLSLDLLNLSQFRHAGSLDPIQWLLPRMIAKLQDISVLLLWLLVAAGWKVTRANLTVVETRALAAVSMLSLYLGVFEVSMGAFEAVRYVIHSLAYLVVIVSVNFEIAYLGSTLSDRGLDRATAELYMRWRGFKVFRVVFMLFVLKPTALLFFKLSVLGDVDRYDWLVVALDNIADVVILAVVANAFRPPENFRLFADLAEVH